MRNYVPIGADPAGKMMILPRRGSDCVPDSVLLVIFVVAACLGTVFAKDTAFVEVVLFESSPNGDYTTYTTGLQGRFSKAGATISAEGEIVQVRVKCLTLIGGADKLHCRATLPGLGVLFYQAALLQTFSTGLGGVNKSRILCVYACRQSEDGTTLASICGYKMAPILWNSFTGKTCSCRLFCLCLELTRAPCTFNTNHLPTHAFGNLPTPPSFKKK